jgi:hypothetical protein
VGFKAASSRVVGQIFQSMQTSRFHARKVLLLDVLQFGTLHDAGASRSLRLRLGYKGAKPTNNEDVLQFDRTYGFHLLL